MLNEICPSGSIILKSALLVGIWVMSWKRSNDTIIYNNKLMTSYATYGCLYISSQSVKKIISHYQHIRTTYVFDFLLIKRWRHWLIWSRLGGNLTCPTSLLQEITFICHWKHFIELFNSDNDASNRLDTSYLQLCCVRRYKIFTQGLVNIFHWLNICKAHRQT